MQNVYMAMLIITGMTFNWHNAYKTRIRQAVCEEAYTLNYEKEINMEAGANYRLRVWLKNGDVAWVSPIFVEK